MSLREDLHEKLALYGEACRAYARAPGFRAVAAMTEAFDAALDAALPAQAGAPAVRYRPASYVSGYHSPMNCDMDILSDASAPPPPAPVALVEAVRAYRAAQRALADCAPAGGTSEDSARLWGTYMAAQERLDSALSAQAGAPAGDKIPWPPEPLMYPNAEWCEAYARWHGRYGPSNQARVEAIEARRLAAQSGGSPAGVARWWHVKRGTTYEEVGRAELQKSGVSYTLIEGDKLVIYRGQDGKLWARDAQEFDDGRFARLATPNGSEG